MTINHCKIRMHNTFKLDSKRNYTIHTGFRKYQTNIMFSHIYRNCDKFRFAKSIREQGKWYMASFYGQVYFPPNNVLIFTDKENENDEILENKNNNDKILCLVGSQLMPDLFKVILKRIIFTGYPFKTKKKRAVIRHMFFNPEDVQYFEKNEIYTKAGLKGKIKGSMGTHGLYKAIFNNFIRQSDTICMNLYRRVFPKFPLHIARN